MSVKLLNKLKSGKLLNNIYITVKKEIQKDIVIEKQKYKLIIELYKLLSVS